MTIRRATIRRVEKEIENAGVPPQDNQFTPQDQVPLGGQVALNPPFMSNGEIRASLLNSTQVMAT